MYDFMNQMSLKIDLTPQKWIIIPISKKKKSKKWIIIFLKLTFSMAYCLLNCKLLIFLPMNGYHDSPYPKIYGSKSLVHEPNDQNLKSWLNC